MSLLRRHAALLALLAVVPIASCSREEADETLRIAVNPWPGYELLVMADREGWYAAEGLPVEIVEFGSLGDARRAFERGHVDGMACTLIEVMQARHLSERLPQVALVCDFSNGADQVVARAPIGDVAGLRGKRVGAETSSLNMFLLARALELSGLGLEDVEIVPMDASAMIGAWDEDEVDAVVCYPPTLVTLLGRPDARAIFTSAATPGEVVDVLAIEASHLERHPERVAALRRVWARALHELDLRREEIVAKMAARERISAEEFAAALGDVVLVDGAQQDELLSGGGTVERAAELVDRTLRLAGLVSGEDRLEALVVVPTP